jgi:D-alanyl-D-alanine carboxypeptidase (penicillin-binding protein 5/6)
MRTPRWRLAALVAAAMLPGLLAGPSAAADPAPAAVTPSAPVGGELLTGKTLVFDRASGVKRPPKVSAKSFVVADATSGAVLAAKAPHLRLPPASTLKTLTALTVIPRLDPDAVHVATREEADAEGSRAGMVPKGEYTVHQMLQALFLASGNDAAVGLARANGGVPATVAQMNALAAELGALDTHAVNTSGLDEDGQLSSAYDLALLGRAALNVPQIVDYATTISAVFPGKPVRPGRKRKTFELWTQQKFVTNYDGALGIKNGYTTKARNTLIAASERDGRRVLVTLMGGGSGTWKDAAALSDWAFANAATAGSVGTLVEPGALAAEAPAAEGGTDAAAAAGDGEGLNPIAAALPGVDGSGSSSSWLVRILLALAAAVAALRARVILRRRRRARARSLPRSRASSAYRSSTPRGYARGAAGSASVAARSSAGSRDRRFDARRGA